MTAEGSERACGDAEQPSILVRSECRLPSLLGDRIFTAAKVCNPALGDRELFRRQPSLKGPLRAAYLRVAPQRTPNSSYHPAPEKSLCRPARAGMGQQAKIIFKQAGLHLAWPFAQIRVEADGPLPGRPSGDSLDVGPAARSDW